MKLFSLFASIGIFSLPLLANVLIAAPSIIERPESRPDWAYRPGDAVKIHVSAEESSTFGIIDYDGKPVDYEKTVQEDGSALVMLPTAANGLFTIKTSSSSTRYAVIPAPGTAISDAGQFGVNFHLDRTPLEDGKKEIDYATFIGISWGRGMFKEFVNCKSTDYEKETQAFDAELEQAKASGMSILGNIYFFPPFMHAEKGPDFIWYAFTAPEDMSEVSNYTRFIAQKCPYVTYWEVGNECDAELFFRGRASSVGNTRQIIKDYVEYLELASRGFHEGNPDCRVLFNGGTGAMPEGETHRPFLKTACEFGACDHFDVMNLHYRGSIPRCRDVLKQFVPEKDYEFWVTEIGGYTDPKDEIGQMRSDILQMMEQFSDGAEKVFKYNMRNLDLDGKNGASANPEDNFGLITLHFQPKMSYVALATFIRLSDRCRNIHRINVTHCSDKGYVKGFSWSQNGTDYSALFLENATEAIVRIPVLDEDMTLIDASGAEHSLLASDGILELSLDRRPIFIRGRLNPPEGKVVYPEDQIVQTIQVPIPNSDFAKGFESWSNDFTPDSTLEVTENGVKVTCNSMTTTFNSLGTWCDINLNELRKNLKPGQFAKARIEADIRYDMEGRGVCACCDMNATKYGERLIWYETGFVSSSSDWTTFVKETDPIRDDIGGMHCAIIVAPGTKGWFEVKNVRITIDIWQKPM